MPDENVRKPDAPSKPRINHGEPHPTADPLVKMVYQMVAANPANPAAVLGWLQSQTIDVVRVAILRAQTAPWSIAGEPLADSLSDEQARGVLAAIVVGIYQGRMTQKQQR